MSTEWDAMALAAAREMWGTGKFTRPLDDLDADHRENVLRKAERVLSAALRVTLPEPCPTCGHALDFENACECECHVNPHLHPASRWAVLPVLQELGVAEQRGWAWRRPPSEDWWLTEYNPPPIVRPSAAIVEPVFGPAPTPENPEVSE